MIRKRTTLTTSERKQRLFLLLFGVILLGAASGVLFLLLKQQGASLGWTRIVGTFFQAEQTVLSLCSEAVSGALIFLLCLFFLGFSAIGQPGAMITLLAYGFCIGGALSVQCSVGNPLLRSLCLLPYFVPVSVLMVIATRESLRFSGLFTAYGFRDDPADQMYHRFRMYCARFTVLLVFLLVIAALYSLAFYGISTAGQMS